jgi:hypothetical protein
MPNTNSIINFKDGFNGGTRANRFRVYPLWPTSVTNNPEQNDASFKMVSSSLPATQVNTIVVPYRGRQITYAGDRMYATWAVGIYDDNNTRNLWKALHRWSENMDGHYTHEVINNDFSYRTLQTTWRVEQLGLNGETIKTIYLYKCWPSVIGEINLNMAEVGFVGFSATLTFDYLKIEDNYNR